MHLWQLSDQRLLFRKKDMYVLFRKNRKTILFVQNYVYNQDINNKNAILHGKRYHRTECFLQVLCYILHSI